MDVMRDLAGLRRAKSQARALVGIISEEVVSMVATATDARADHPIFSLLSHRRRLSICWDAVGGSRFCSGLFPLSPIVRVRVAYKVQRNLLHEARRFLGALGSSVLVSLAQLVDLLRSRQDVLDETTPIRRRTA